MLIYGKNTCLEAIKSKRNIIKAFVSKQMYETINNLLNNNCEIEIKDSKELDLLVDGVHQGIILETSDYEYVSIEKLVELNKSKNDVCFALLDSLEDPHNLGAILRTCDAAGIDGVIFSKNRSVGLSNLVAKISTGAIEYVPCSRVTNLVQTIEYLKSCGYWIIGTELDGSVSYDKQDYSGKIVVVIGSEGKGISKIVKDHCDYLIRIPMVGHVNSLNASVSASLIFYEVLRNRLKNK